MHKKIQNNVKPEKGTVPTKIILEEKIEQSPKKLAELMNTFFVKNIEEIQKNFKPEANNPISYLEKLIQKPEDRLR